jgi:hypothetical protein
MAHAASMNSACRAVATSWCTSTCAPSSSTNVGGGVVNESGGETTVNSTISGNTAAGGSGSSNLGASGGILNQGGGETLVYVTLAGNKGVTGATNNAANYVNQGGTVQWFGTVVGDPTGGANCRAVPGTAFVSNGHNLEDDPGAICGFSAAKKDIVGKSPQLAALADNSGPGPTQLPQPGSPLIDTIPPASCRADGASAVTTDERGVSRPQGSGCDIGAVEVVESPPTTATPVVSSNQFSLPNQTDVFDVARNGAVEVRWVVGGGSWQGPMAISRPGLAAPGTELAASNQFGIANQTDVWVVDKTTGTIQVLWVQGGGTWQGPLTISTPGLASSGAHLAASNQFGISNQTDVFVADTTGTLKVVWVQGAGKWQGPLRIGPNGKAPSGAGLAASNQFGIPNQTDVWMVDKGGTVRVFWVAGFGGAPWLGPLGIGPTGLAPAGAPLSASNQFGLPNQTDLFVVDKSGTRRVVWVQGGGVWQGPLSISPLGLDAPGAPLTSSNQFGVPNQTDVWAIDKTGTLEVVWVQNAGTWQGPLAI